MIRQLLLVLAGAVALAVAPNGVAEDAKPTTLEGSLVCTKCKLKETKACGQCLIVKDSKDAKKEVKYYLVDKGGEADYHGDICQGPKDAKVTGKVVEKDGKTTIEDPKVEFIKK